MKRSLSLSISLLLLLLLVSLTSSARIRSSRVKRARNGEGNSDEITNLPGLPSSATFKQYAGYVTVDELTGRNLFYWYVESQNDPANDPLVLWLNGGPGCSSLGGLLSENGPFWPTAGGESLELNDWSWNKVANVLYLESPSGVGFSYSNDVSDYHTGDARTANDSYTFLLKFFDRYPSLKGRDFWITGESYGGHYVPNLALRIIEGNDRGSPKINLKGFMVGNAWTDAKIDNAGAAFYWWTHAVVPKETIDKVFEYCDFSNIGPLKAANGIESPDTKKCDEATNEAMKEMGDINIYDIYQDVCRKNYQGERLISQWRGPIGKIMEKLTDKKAPPCIDDYVQKYLNRDDVQSAIHAHSPYKWTDCSPRVNYSYEDLLSSELPTYELLFTRDLRILIYSGDVDAIVPYTGTREWISQLRLVVKNPWREYMVANQVGGYVTEYDKLTLATVRDAGHMVPGTQPERGFHMFSKFLAGEEM